MGLLHARMRTVGPGLWEGQGRRGMGDVMDVDEEKGDCTSSTGARGREKNITRQQFLPRILPPHKHGCPPPSANRVGLHYRIGPSMINKRGVNFMINVLSEDFDWKSRRRP